MKEGDLSNCCKATIRYLDCEDCREEEKQCIYICSECGADCEEIKNEHE